MLEVWVRTARVEFSQDPSWENQGPNNNLVVPKPCELTNAPEYGKFPFIFVGDEAFPLKLNLMRPYPGHGLDRTKRIFNYRSRAR